MPEVLDTGFLVGFFEWACTEAVNLHLDRPKEQTLGTSLAATPTTRRLSGPRHLSAPPRLPRS